MCIGIQANINILEERFYEIYEAFIDILQCSSIDVNILVRLLTKLPAHEKGEHKMFLEKKLQELRKSEDNEDLIGKLSFYWNYLSPQLLAYLVKDLCKIDEKVLTVHRDMDSYKVKLQEFRVQTPLYLFSKLANEVVIPPQDFSKMSVYFKRDIKFSKTTTLEDVEQLRVRYVKHYQLRDFALMLAPEIKIGSFIVYFIIPNSIIEMLKNNVPQGILQEFSITRLELELVESIEATRYLVEPSASQSRLPTDVMISSIMDISSTPHSVEATSTPHSVEATSTIYSVEATSTLYSMASTLYSAEVTSTPHSVEATSTPHSVEATSTPHSVEATSTPHSMEATSTPHPVEATSTPHPVEATSTPHPVEATSTPHPMEATSTPHPMEATSTPHPVEATSTPHPVEATSTPHPVEATSTSYSIPKETLQVFKMEPGGSRIEPLAGKSHVSGWVPNPVVSLTNHSCFADALVATYLERGESSQPPLSGMYVIDNMNNLINNYYSFQSDKSFRRGI